MSWEFVRKEWGAVTFVLTVLVGLIVVPLALYLGNHNPNASAPSAGPAAAVTTSASTTSTTPQVTTTHTTTTASSGKATG